MLHRIRDAERRRIRDKLEAANSGDWKKIASEIDYGRNQIYFWFLVDDDSRIDKAVIKVMQILRPFVSERQSAQFNVGFIELTDRHKIDWETIDDETLRQGQLNHPPGSSPWRTARPKFTVFDRPEYSISPSDEPI